MRVSENVLEYFETQLEGISRLFLLGLKPNLEGSWTDYTEKGFGADWRKCREVRKIEWVHFTPVSASSSHLHFIITLATVERWGWAARLTIQCI